MVCTKVLDLLLEMHDVCVCLAEWISSTKPAVPNNFFSLSVWLCVSFQGV